VDVLLATFNGEKFLEEQLQSLDQQEDVIVRVWANDDGSDDATLSILLKWQKSGLIKDISTTQRVGSTHAFLKLLSEHSNSEYVAFCDQDDVWDPITLITQVGKLTSEMPMAITSRRLYIDSVGSIIGESKRLRKAPSFENAMLENIAPGNTILMNRRAIELINEFPNPRVTHYDSWVYLLI
jgi:glycosyltransferase involved in cell wall biosynthesis